MVEIFAFLHQVLICGNKTYENFNGIYVENSNTWTHEADGAVPVLQPSAR